MEQLNPTEIKFRGLSEHGQWYFGYYWALISVNPMVDHHYIRDQADHRIKKETIGQFIGMHDKTKKEIFVGDIYRYEFEYDSDYDGDMPIVKTAKGLGVVKDIHDRGQIIWAKQEGDGVEIIGNIFENSELLHSKRAGGI